MPDRSDRHPVPRRWTVLLFAATFAACTTTTTSTTSPDAPAGPDAEATDADADAGTESTAADPPFTPAATPPLGAASEVLPGVRMAPTMELVPGGAIAPFVTAFGDGFMLIRADGIGSSVVERSADGSTWERVGTLSAGSLHRLATDGRTVVAVAEVEPAQVGGLTTWLSTDGGAGWTELPLPDFRPVSAYLDWQEHIDRIAVMGPTVVMMGRVFPRADWRNYVIDAFGVDHGNVTGEGGGSGGWVVSFEDGTEVNVDPADIGLPGDDFMMGPTTIWRMSEGVWSAADQPSGAMQALSAAGLGAGPAGYVTIASGSQVGAGVVVNDAFRSTDGETWTPSPVPEVIAAEGAVVAGGPLGYVAVGRTTIHHSSDAVTWTLVHEFGALDGPGMMAGVFSNPAAGAAGFAVPVLGMTESGPVTTLLTSPDGQAWSAVPLPEGIDGIEVAVSGTATLVVPYVWPQTPFAPPVLAADDDTAAAIAAAFTGSTAGAWPPSSFIGADEAECIGEGLVQSVGEARLREIGFGAVPWHLLGYGLGLPIERPDADLIVPVLRDCAPHWELLMITSVTEGADRIGEESANCVAAALDDDVAAEIFVLELARDDMAEPMSAESLDYLGALTDTLADCLTPAERNGLDFN